MADDTGLHGGTGYSGLEPLGLDSLADPPRAWELIESGRYQPRRIRGSLPGRELG